MDLNKKTQTGYQVLIATFDTAKAMSIVDIRTALGITNDEDERLEGDMLWLVRIGLLATPEKAYKSGNHGYRLTAKGHRYALNRKCPLEASLRSKKLW